MTNATTKNAYTPTSLSFADNDHDYVVVGDLHGVNLAADFIHGLVTATPNLKAAFLGDVVDRGPSSYKTFSRVWDLVRHDQAIHTTSNHDNKFYRWLLKFKNAESFSDLTFGMTLAHGLEGTVHEFLSLEDGAQANYMADFINYYESASSVIKMKRKYQTHYFAHAGLTERMLAGDELNRKDASAAMYEAMEGRAADEISMHHASGDEVFVHLGHDFFYNGQVRTEREVFTSFFSKNHHIVKHDMGYGKMPYDEVSRDFWMIDG